MTTLEDVARETGLSAKTASLALRGAAGVAEDTVARVQEAAKKLNYAQRRRSPRKTVRVGVCIPDLKAAHYQDFAQSIIHCAWVAGFVVVILATNDNSADEKRAEDVLKRLSADAVIFTSSRMSQSFVTKLEEDERMLAILLLSELPEEESSQRKYRSALIVDHVTGTCKATEHLIKLGHRRIAYLAGPRNSSSNTAKHRGYRKALDEKGLPAPDYYVARPDGPRFDFQAGNLACRDLMQLPSFERPTAIICYNDELALGALSALHQQNIEVPDDVSIVGNDNIPYTQFSNPPLSTIYVPRSVLADAAIDMIDLWVNSGEVKEYAPFVPELKLRSSTGKHPPSEEPPP